MEFNDQPTMDGTARPRADTTAHALAERYEVLEKLGEGGMGIVLKARDRETSEVVAVKVLRAEIAANTAAMERFKSEVRLARSITHKNVCRVHELLRFGDTVIISMEYVEGENLRRVLTRSGGLRVGRGLQIVGQICAGLAEAHAQGVVHRDLKPENVMLDQDGNVKIMDFGIARGITRPAEGGLTQDGALLGTPAYMAPEQAAGKTADHRADIYSLGLIVYEMLTGVTAFRGDTPIAVALKQVHDTPSAPRELEPTLPAYIEKTILKCLEKNPEKRFQSAEAL